MPFRRRYRTRRRRPALKTFAQRRITRRTSNRRPISQKISLYNMPTHYFKRKCKLITLETNGYGYASNSFIFGLNQLPNYTEFTGLFDQYCLRYIKLYIVHRATDVTTWDSTNNAFGMPNIIAVRDYDDGATVTADETGYNELREYAKSKTFSFTGENRCFSIGLKPAIRAELYQSGISTTYTPKFSQFVDMTTANTPHYGIKCVIQMPTNNTIGTAPKTYFDVYATFYVACKNVR